MAAAAIDNLLSSDHFSICVVRDLAAAIGAPRHSPAMQLLSTLHCVNYRTMPEETRAMLPQLIAEALSTTRQTAAREAILAQIDFQDDPS